MRGTMAMVKATVDIRDELLSQARAQAATERTMPRRTKRRPPRCQYRAIRKNTLTGDLGFYQCGGAGTNRYQMCSEPGKHPEPPNDVGKDGWLIEQNGWTRDH